MSDNYPKCARCKKARNPTMGRGVYRFTIVQGEALELFTTMLCEKCCDAMITTLDRLISDGCSGDERIVQSGNG